MAHIHGCSCNDVLGLGSEEAPELEERIRKEIEWGLKWLLKTRFDRVSP
jgi:hypothetical protein